MTRGTGIIYNVIIDSLLKRQGRGSYNVAYVGSMDRE